MKLEGFGHLVVVDVPVRAPGLAPLHPEEAALSASWGPQRQATFAAGRHALRLALRAADVVVDGPIGRDDRGAPLFPGVGVVDGVVASVTHKNTVAAALVSTELSGWCVGVDLELLEPRARPALDRLIRQVLTEREAAQLPDDDDGRLLACLLRFSLKEALYKSLDPWVRRYVGFQEVEVDVDAAGAAVFTVPQFDGRRFEAVGRVVNVQRPDVLLTVARCRPAG